MSTELLEDKLARRKRIFNETAISIATSEPEDIAKMIRQTVEDVESLREKEAALRKIFADKIGELKDDRLSQLRTYVPIPPSAYKDENQEKRTRPTKEAHENGGVKIRAKSKSAEDKNAEAIMKALGLGTINEAKAWLESKKQPKPMIAAQPTSGVPEDGITEEDLEKEAEQGE